MTLAPEVLICDPDQSLSRTLLRVLQENGYAATVYPYGADLFAQLESRGADLVMLDTAVPDGGGLRWLERIKDSAGHRLVPVMMLATDPPEELAEQVLGAGAADLITKPFRVRELLARVRMHVRLGRELGQARADALARAEMVDILREITTSLRPEEIFTVLVRRVAEGLRISRCSIL
ncbi:MAG: response regulator transcription factor, partial [Gemmatimonadales bacterium]